MKNIFSIVAVLIALSFFTKANAQSKTFLVNGKVISFEESIGLEGVTVYVKGTKVYTGTQADGQFTIDVPKGHNILVLELKGYATQEITINASKAYDFILKQVGNNVNIQTATSCSSTVK